MKNALNKDIFREILRTRSKFLSIIAMVALGAFVFVGLLITGPMMRETMNHYIMATEVADITIQSTLGLDFEDRFVIEHVEGSKKIEYGHQKDVMISSTEQTLRLESLGESLPKYMLVEGRLPQKSGEIAIDSLMIGDRFRVGDSLSLIDVNGEPVKEGLKRTDYVVVGLVESPEYTMTDNKGRATIGTGELDGFGVIRMEDFDREDFSIARITLVDKGDYRIETPAYQALVNEFKNTMDVAIENRPGGRLATVRRDALKKIDEGQEELEDARSKLSDAEKELMDARIEIDKAYVAYNDGKAQLNDEIALARQELEDAKKQILTYEREWTDGRAEYEVGLERYTQEIQQAEEQLNDAKIELDQAREKLEPGIIAYEKGLAEFNQKFAAAEQELAQSKNELDQALAQITEGENQLAAGQDALEAEIAKGKQEIEAGEAALVASRKQIDDGNAQVQAARIELAEKEKELKSNLEEVNAALLDLEPQLEPLESGLEVLSAQIAAVDDQLSRVNQAISEINGQIDSLTAEIQELQAQILALQGQIDALLLEDPVDQEEIDRLRAQINTLQADIDAKNQNIEVLRGSLSQSEAEKAALEAQKSGLIQQQSVLEGQKQALLSAIEPLRLSKQQLEQGLIEIEQAQATLNEQQAALDSAEVEYQKGLKDLEAAKAKLIEAETTGRAQLEKSRQELDEAKTEYQNGLSAYEEGLKTLKDEKEKAQSELDAAKKTIDDAQQQIDLGEEAYQQGLLQFQNERGTGLEKLASSKKTLDEAERSLSDARSEVQVGDARIEEERRLQEQKLTDALYKIQDAEAEYQSGMDEYTAEKADAEDQIRTGEEDIATAKKDLAKIKLPNYYVKDINDNMGLYVYLENSRRMDMLSRIFPIFFFLIAILVTLTTMSRMVEENRLQIGTLKALGYQRSDIAKKYLVYGALSSIIGSIIGIVFGHTLLTLLIFDAYSSGFTINQPVLSFYPVAVILTFVVSVALTVGTAFLTTARSMQNNAATLLRPKSPKSGNRIFLERIAPIWSRLTFLHKVTARNIFRYKGRMLMTIIGIAGCTALLFMGLGIRDSIQNTVPVQFRDFVHYDLMTIWDVDAEEEELNRYRREVDNESNVRDTETLRYEMGMVTFDQKPSQDISIMAFDHQLTENSLITVRSPGGDEILSLNDYEVIVTEKLARLLDLEVGDPLEFEDSDHDAKTVIVSGIAENYIGHNVYMNRITYEEYFEKEMVENAEMIRFYNKSADDVDAILSRLTKEPAVLSVLNNNRIHYQIGELLASLNMVVIVLLICSSMLAIVVLYNLTNINISERIRELSTIKVLGFYPNEITAYVTRETFILTSIGILIGYALGRMLHLFIILVVVPDNVSLFPKILWTNYLTSAAITLLLSVFVMRLMHQKLKKINMVEALKAIE